MVTLKTIAMEAGVSVATVSNVIHENYKKVSAKNIEKIKKIIEKYNYVPNSNARSLALKKSMIIAIVIPYVAKEDSFLNSPYNAEIVGVLEKVIRDSGYYTMVRSVQISREAISLLHTWNVDGVIFLGADKQDIGEIQKKVKIPVMFVDTYAEGEEFSNVGVEDEYGGYIATKYLLNRGHENIWFVGPQAEEEGVVKKRFQGYEQALKEAGLSGNSHHLFARVTSYECGVELGKQIAGAERQVTGVFASADILAIGIMEGLHLCGKKVPEEVSVIGFDDLPVGRYCWPKLTTISQNTVVKATLIAEALLAMVKEEEEKFIRKTVKVNLIERDSVGTQKRA